MILQNGALVTIALFLTHSVVTCLCCLQSLIGGSIFSKTRNYQKIGFPPKPDVIMMSPNVHEWKGKAKVHCMIPVFNAADH